MIVETDLGDVRCYRDEGDGFVFGTCQDIERHRKRCDAGEPGYGQ